MAKNAIISGMTGVYLVAAELSKRGFIVSPTSRGAEGADLLVTDQERCSEIPWEPCRLPFDFSFIP